MTESSNTADNNGRTNQHQIARTPHPSAGIAPIQWRAGIMSPVILGGAVLGIALLATALNVTPVATQSETHYGSVVTSTNKMLVMTDEDGLQSSHAVTADTRVTRDGVECQAADLGSGVRIRVTTDDAHQSAAIAIDATVKDARTVEDANRVM